MTGHFWKGGILREETYEKTSKGEERQRHDDRERKRGGIKGVIA